MFVPTTFGKYFLTEKLATGGMAEIYRGKLLGPGGFEKQLVIKQIHPRLIEHREFVDLFVAEAKTSVSLSHGNIVPIYELGVVDGTYFIAMEFVDGPTLAELMKQARARGRRLGPAVAATILVEVLKGLDYAHRKGNVIHRDLSPRNVMVSRDGEVKIVDFGLAASFDSAAQLSRASSGSGRPVGSFPYMSPEQATRAPLDARSDIFSAGILLWELLTGETLFQRADDDATLEAVRTAAVPPPSSRAPEVPPALDAVVLRALARDRDARFPSAGELAAALTRYLHSVADAVGAEGLSAVVNELCPDVPTAAEAPATTPSEPETSGTRPMSRTPAQERSFATHVDLERALERNRTPLMPFPAIDGLVKRVSETPAAAPATPPAPAPAPAPVTAPAPAAPRSRAWLVLPVLGAAGLVVAVVLALRPGPAPAAAADAAAATAADAAAATAAAADAALALAADAATAAVLTSPADAAPVALPAPRADAAPVERGRGRLVVAAPEVAWATVYVDGVRVGETPIPAPGLELPAGRHTLRVVCDPAVCPPDGKERTFPIVIAADGTLERSIRF